MSTSLNSSTNSTSASSSSASSSSASSVTSEKGAQFVEFVDCNRCFSKQPRNEANGPNCGGCEDMYEEEYSRCCKRFDSFTNSSLTKIW
jgi:hypothetical protein